MRRIDYIYTLAFLIIGASYFGETGPHNLESQSLELRAAPNQTSKNHKLDVKDIGRLENELTQAHNAIALLQLEVQQLQQEFNNSASVAVNTPSVKPAQNQEHMNIGYNIASSAPALQMETQLKNESNNVELDHWVEDNLLSKLENTTDNSITNIETQCGSTLCKAKIEFSSGERETALDALLQAMPTDNFDIVEDYTNVIVVYIHKNPTLENTNDS